MDPNENTVIRIRTADAFAQPEKGLAQARMVIDHFEEEQTRLASLSGDQLKILRRDAPRDSSEMTAATPPPTRSIEPPSHIEPPSLRAPLAERSRRETDEPTVARSPLGDELSTPTGKRTFDPPNQSIDSDEHTRMIAPRDRRTPVPERTPRASTNAPPPSRGPIPTPPPLPRGTEMLSAPVRTMQPPPTAPMPPQQPLQAPPPMPQLPMPQMPRVQPPYAPQLWTPQPPYPPQQRMPTQAPPQARQPFVQPWMLIVGALLMAALAFGVTRACIGSSAKPATPASPDK
jgi:hypothetical protein